METQNLFLDPVHDWCNFYCLIMCKNNTCSSQDAQQLDFVYKAAVSKPWVVPKSAIFMIRCYWKDKCSPVPKCITSRVCCSTPSSVSGMLLVSEPTRVSDHNQHDTCWGCSEAPAHMGHITGLSNWLASLRELEPVCTDWWSYSMLACWVCERETANLWGILWCVCPYLPACACGNLA